MQKTVRENGVGMPQYHLSAVSTTKHRPMAHERTPSEHIGLTDLQSWVSYYYTSLRFCRVQTSFANSRSCSIRSLLGLELLFKFSKLLHGNFFFLIQHLRDALNFLDVVHEHALDAILQCNCARIARPTSSPQFQKHITVLEPPELDIATIFLNGRSNASFQKLLDHSDYLTIAFVVAEGVLLANFMASFSGSVVYRIDNLLTQSHGLRNQTEYLGFQMGPVGVSGFGDGDKVRAVKHRGNSINIEQSGRQR